MKLSFVLLLALPTGVSGATSQPECQPWTQMHLYDTNPALQPAEDAYVEMVAGTLEANCMDENGVPKECKLGLGQSDRGDAYSAECAKNGGHMWTYTLHPLCGDISSTSQTELTGVLVCASASCESVGTQNLIPNQGFYAPFEAAGYTCGSGTSDLKKVELEPISSQPECYNWTQMHLFDTNEDMKPAEDAYFEVVAETLEANCLENNVFTGCGETVMGEGDRGNTYLEECHENGGHIWSYTVSPLCGDFSSSSTAGKLSGVMVCASASCESVGVSNLIPPMQAIFAPFYELNYTCGAATNDLEKISVPSTKVDDDSPGEPASGAFFRFSWASMVMTLLAF